MENKKHFAKALFVDVANGHSVEDLVEKYDTTPEFVNAVSLSVREWRRVQSEYVKPR